MDRFKGKKSTTFHPSPRRRPWNIRSHSSPAPPLGSVMRQPACSPSRATARSSSPGAAWPRSNKRPLNSRLNQGQVFTPLELDLDTPTSVQSALAELVKLGRPIDFLLLNAGMVAGKKRVLTASGIEAAEAPLIGHHQLVVGLPPTC